MDRKTYLDMLNTEFKTKFFWRDICVEFVATFILMSVQCVVPLTWTTLNPNAGFGGIVHQGLGMGFIVCATAWTFGDFGGAHMNPSVTLAMVICLKITFVKAVFYVVAQSAGALVGTAFICMLTPEINRETLSATVPNPDISSWQAVLVEAWLTFILVCTIQGATNARRKGHIYMPTIVIGFVVTVAVLTGTQYTGGSMNPARSLGPAVIMGIWKQHWVYWVGPLSGASLAAVFYNYILDNIGDIPEAHSHPARNYQAVRPDCVVDTKEINISQDNRELKIK